MVVGNYFVNVSKQREKVPRARPREGGWSNSYFSFGQIFYFQLPEVQPLAATDYAFKTHQACQPVFHGPQTIILF